MMYAALMRRLTLWQRPHAQGTELVVNHRGILSPGSVLCVLLARSFSQVDVLRAGTKSSLVRARIPKDAS